MRAREQTERMLNWWAKNGIERADLAVRRADGAMLWHAGLALDCLPLGWARAENARQAEVYVRPARDAPWPGVFLDDVRVGHALRAADECAALIIRTSRAGGCHLWLRASFPLDEGTRHEWQQRLAEDWGADRASTSGEHLGRLAGFRNWKRAGEWVNVLAASTGGPISLPIAQSASVPVRQRTPVARHNGPGDSSPSGREWGWVLGALEAGMPPATVYARLVQRARARRGADAERYARHTLRRALASTNR